MTKYIIANWKMNMTLEDTRNWFANFNVAYCECETIILKTIVAPSTAFLPIAFEQAAKNIELSAQDVSVAEQGSHTGEDGIFQLKNFVSYCIVGHSERREAFEIVLAKRDMCLAHGITPIVCFVDPEKVTNYYTEGVILAWEDPQNISANGVFHPKDPKEIEYTVAAMKKALPEEAVIVYGGSVSGQTIGDLVKLTQLDGVLVGSASLDPLSFLDIIRAYEIYEP